MEDTPPTYYACHRKEDVKPWQMDVLRNKHEIQEGVCVLCARTVVYIAPSLRTFVECVLPPGRRVEIVCMRCEKSVVEEWEREGTRVDVITPIIPVDPDIQELSSREN